MGYERRSILTGAASAGALALAGCIGDDDDPDETDGDPEETTDTDPSISITQPTDGATVDAPVTIAAAVENFVLESAENDPREGAGHAHVLIDRAPYDAGETIPFEDGIVHLSDGGNSTDLELATGEHELTMQLANAAHVAHDAWDTVTVTVADVDETDDSGGGPY